MNARNTCWVERVDGNIVRIFRSTHGEDWSRAMAAGTLQTCPKKDAVGEIRGKIWKRCAGRCEWCGSPVTESGSLRRRMHQHEKVFKGKGGGSGEVSLDNCVGICYDCHFNDPAAHGDRRPQFSGKLFAEET